LGFKVYRTEKNGGGKVIASGKARNVATHTQAESSIGWKIDPDEGKIVTPLDSHLKAINEVLSLLSDRQVGIDAVGHRFVHGGELFKSTTLIDDAAMQKLQKCLPLAPIHNPNSYSVIEVCKERLPGTPQYAVFDTAFHSSMPAEAREYAIPRNLAQAYGLRKYGFHGLSYQYVSRKAAELLRKPLNEVKLIMCHLGTGGSSVCAFADGHSVETSMGYSPLAGLVMSTRCGDIDAEVVLELARRGLSTGEIEDILNDRSGLLGLSGYSSNLAEIIEAAENGNKDCLLAYQVYADRLKFYLGAYTWYLNGADAVIFTDDIGVKSWKLREKVCSNADRLGIRLDADTNRKATTGNGELISTPDSMTRVIVVATDEESVIFTEVLEQIDHRG
jgi:acetate kinase